MLCDPNKAIDISTLTNEQCIDLFQKSKKLNYKPYAVRYLPHSKRFLFMRYKEIVKRGNVLYDCYLFDDILDVLDISANQQKVLWK